MCIIASLVIAVVGILLQQLLAPKQQFENARPRGLGDFDFPTATQGRVIPVLYGTCSIEAPNVVWWGDLMAEPITKYVRGSFFSGSRVILGYKYHIGVQAVLCRGGSTGLKSISGYWIGDTKVSSSLLTPDGNSYATEFIDRPDLFGGSGGGGGVQMQIDYHFGGPTQTANGYLAIHQSGGNTSIQEVHPGTAYIVARRQQQDVYIGGVLQPYAPGGAYVGNSTTIKPWKWECTRIPALMPGQPAGENLVGSYDANPINVVYEAITSREFSNGTLAADVDTGASGSFVTAATTLRNEGNGFSILLTKHMPLGDLIKEVERQIDGKIFLDHRSGKWKCKLARADYDINTVPQIGPSMIGEIRDFSRGTWQGTANYVTVEFNNRDDNYAVGYGLAQDQANMLMQGGGSFSTMKIVTAPRTYPGCKSAALANNLAWRDLRDESQPKVRAIITLNRELWDLSIFDVVAWTDPKRGLNKLPMRVMSIDFGTIAKNAMTISLVQDVYSFQEPSFGDPETSEWLTPGEDLVAYPAGDQIAFEAPRGILLRDPDSLSIDSGSNVANYIGPRIMAAVRQQGPETGFLITARHAPGTPGGAFSTIGEVSGFLYVGRLNSSLSAGVATPSSSITIVPNPSSLEQLLGALAPDFVSITPTDVGTELANLILVGNEFMLVTSAQVSGSNVQLNTVYRGVLDSVQESHAAGDLVYLLFVGSGMSAPITGTDNYDVQLRMRRGDTVFAGGATTISFLADLRVDRPYPPNAPLYNGSSTPYGTPSLEGAGSGLNGARIDVRWRRRQYNQTNEVTAVTTDDPSGQVTIVNSATTPPPTLPSTIDAADGTYYVPIQYQLIVRADPNGANTLVFTSAWTSTLPIQLLRSDVFTAAPAGTLLRVSIKARHEINTSAETSTVYESRYAMTHDVTPTSAYTGLFYFGGGLAANVASASYTAAATGTFTLNIGAAQATANIQVSLNGGAFSSVITAGNTTGTFAATSGDTIRVRRTVSEAPNPQFVELRNPSSAAVAYGTFKS